MTTKQTKTQTTDSADAIAHYAETRSTAHAAICQALRAQIDAAIPKAASKIWHGSPVWFVGENTVVGYSVTAKNGVSLLFFFGGHGGLPRRSVTDSVRPAWLVGPPRDGSRSDCMPGRVTPQRRGSYGIDAPFAPAFLAGLAMLYLVLAITTGRARFWLAVLFISAVEALYFHTALRGKFVVWAELLDGLRLRGDERILDLGCGRGAVLLMAAQHLTTGRAVGVDLWRKVDQSGNSAEATQRNAVAEGVADRVELHTGDLRALPFEDNGFDVVLSNFAIHNISGRAGREKAISEAVRVLRPGGRLLIVDVRVTRQHQAQLTRLGMHDVARSGLGWWFQPARLVTATKPQPGHWDGPSTFPWVLGGRAWRRRSAKHGGENRAELFAGDEPPPRFPARGRVEVPALRSRSGPRFWRRMDYGTPKVW